MTIDRIGRNTSGSYPAEYRIDQVLDTQGDGTGTYDHAVAGKAITAATNATPIVITSAAHGFSDGDHVTINGVVGNTAANGFWIVANKTTDTFELTDLDGTDVAGNGAWSSGGKIYPAFVIKPAAGTNYHILRMNIVAGDASAPTSITYLGATALTNGVVLEVYNAAGLLHTLTAKPVKMWAQWGLNCGTDFPVLDLTGGHTGGAVRWTFTKGTGYPILLNGDDGEFMALRIQDDLDGLTLHEAAVQGSI